MGWGRWVLAGLLLAAPAARAEDEGHRYSLHPSLRLVGVADDNAYLDDDDRDGAVGVWIQPGLEAGYRGRWLELGTDVGADIRRYPGEPSLDDEFWRAVTFAELGLLSGLTARISDTFVPQPVQLGRPEGETENLVQTHRLEGRLRYWRELPRARELELGVSGTRFLGESFAADVLDSDGSRIVDAHFRPDYWEGAGYAEVQNPLGRQTSVFVRGQAQYRAFDDAPRSDHLDASLLAGMRSRRFKDLELELAGGWGLLHFDRGDSRNRFLAEGSLLQRLPRGWSWRAAAHHRFSEDLTGDEFIETTLRLGLEKRLGARTAAELSLFGTRFESEHKDRRENLFAGVEVELRRQLMRRLQAKIRYRHWRNAGDYEFDDFYQNQIALELAYRY